jgi:hypothetical protein
LRQLEGRGTIEDVLRKKPEPPITREEVRGLTVMIVRIDEKIDRVLDLLEDDDGEEEAED